MPRREVSALPVLFVHATVASRSEATWTLRNLVYDGQDILDVGLARDVALTRIEVGRDCEVAPLREAEADILDVLVDAEDFMHHEDRREGPARGGHRAIGGNFAALDGNLHLVGDETVAIGGD